MRGERGAVLDEALLVAVPPDEVRDAVDVAVAAGRDRREADRRQRRERRDGAAVAAVVEQEPERRRVGRLEHRRRQPVDDDQDDRLRRTASGTQSRASVRRPAWRSGVRRRTRPRSPACPTASRKPSDRHESDGRRRRSRRAPTSSADPGPRAAAPERAGDDRSGAVAAGNAAGGTADRLHPREGEERERGSADRADDARRRRQRGYDPGDENADRDADPGEHADPVPGCPSRSSVSPTGPPALRPIGDDPADARPRLLRRLPRYPLEIVRLDAAPDLGRDDPRLPRLRGAVRAAAAHGRRRGRRLTRRRLGDRPLGALGQRLVPRDRAAWLRRPGPLLRVLPAVPAARPRGRLAPARPPPGRGGSRLAGCVGRRVRAALEASLQLTGEQTANRSVFYLSIFPTTLFLFAVYSESLYLLLTVAAFLLAVRGRWGWAGVVVGLAALTRVSGVILLPALAILAWRSADRKAGAAPARDLPAGDGALAALPRPRPRAAVRVPRPSAPAGIAGSPMPGRSGGPGTGSSTAGAVSDSSSPARATTTSRASTTARCTAPA